MAKHGNLTVKADELVEISDDLWDGVSVSLEVDSFVKSEHDGKIILLKTKRYGGALMRNGHLKLIENDDFSYQEMMSFLPLCSHKKPKDVLIVGDGDGGIARQVAKYNDVENIDVVEIDKKVVELCEQHIPSTIDGIKHSKVKWHFKKGSEYMEQKQNENKYDVIITDSSEPVDEVQYLKSMKKALKSNGVICIAVPFLWQKIDKPRKMFQNVKKVFQDFENYAFAVIPNYPTGHIGMILASTSRDINFSNPSFKLTDDFLDKNNIRYYSPDIHIAAFTLPRKFQKDFA